ncbi:DUF535 family protein [Rhodanobacter sp. C01]|uniref:VirK/YbjX family protein n=1 Tax=Rhodanobacter sp. C01 TaxID=1945856 RepID=UPI0009C99F7C|nr:DUF535 family protein [Rhodanobacter sp. C01]OOG49469.1 hypothetical protein B0E50_04930 [Rhodanobacter sp. C01]
MNKLSHRAGAEAVETGTPFAACGYINAVSPMLGGSLGSFIRRLRNMVGRQLADLRGADRPRAITNFLRSLHHRQDWLNRPSKHRKMAIKYVVRALCMPRQHGRYLAFVFGNPHMCACQRRDPRMLERHFHRYIHLQWDRPTRLQSIQRHYRFALAQLPCALFEAIYVYGNATLGNLTLKDGGQLKLCLRPPISVGCEGELCIQLSDADDHPVYRLILTVIGDRPTIAIGCLQGPDDQNGKDMVRDMTKNMYGMRPKQLMLSLAYAFAKHFRIERILAVSNAAHPLRRVRDKFRADYDAFWLEQKGSDVGNGWFMLPEALSRKSESEVSSHHRSAFRRREIMRIEAERLLIDALEAYPSRSSATPSGKELESVRSSQHDNLDASWIR